VNNPAHGQRAGRYATTPRSPVAPGHPTPCSRTYVQRNRDIGLPMVSGWTSSADRALRGDPAAYRSMACRLRLRAVAIGGFDANENLHSDFITVLWLIPDASTTAVLPRTKTSWRAARATTGRWRTITHCNNACHCSAFRIRGENLSPGSCFFRNSRPSRSRSLSPRLSCLLTSGRVVRKC
jgi:hypothetical protein